MSFFLDMSEADIAKQLNLGQSTIHYHKANSLKELKKIMEIQTRKERVNCYPLRSFWMQQRENL